MDLFDLLLYKSVAGDSGGGGGGEISTQSINISANGTYRAPTGKAYTPVNVNVPNSYGASDEGKVVDDGALVSQTTETISQNGTVDTTTVREVTVNVPNTYEVSDEGKVVSNGALVSQTAHASVTENGTIDTTLNNSVEVAVPVPTLESKSIDANGTYTPESGKAWNSVVVAIPAVTGVSF